MPSFHILLDPDKDLENWLQGSQHSSYGQQRTAQLSPQLQPLLSLCAQDDSEHTQLAAALSELYINKQEEIARFQSITQHLLDRNWEELIQAIEHMTGKPRYREDFTLYLTSFPRCPYHYPKGELRISFFSDPKRCGDLFLHEFQHLQVHHYFERIAPMKRLDSNAFHTLKEALTVLLNAECAHLLKETDHGYPAHQQLRAQLLSYRHQEKNFKKLIAYGCSLLLSKSYPPVLKL